MKSTAFILFCLGFCLGGEYPLPAAKAPVDNASDSSFLGLKLGARVFLLSDLLPKQIGYRRNSPYGIELGLEFNFSHPVNFEIFCILGKFMAKGDPFYCLECGDDNSESSSASDLMGAGLKYPIKKWDRFKKLWITSSLEKITYEWEYNGQYKVLRMFLNEGTLQSSILFLGINSENYIIRRGISLGIDAVFKIPVYIQNELDTRGFEIDKKFAPVLVLGLKARI